MNFAYHEAEMEHLVDDYLAIRTTAFQGRVNFLKLLGHSVVNLVLWIATEALRVPGIVGFVVHALSVSRGEAAIKKVLNPSGITLADRWKEECAKHKVLSSELHVVTTLVTSIQNNDLKTFSYQVRIMSGIHPDLRELGFVDDMIHYGEMIIEIERKKVAKNTNHYAYVELGR